MLKDAEALGLGFQGALGCVVHGGGFKVLGFGFRPWGLDDAGPRFLGSC